MGSEISRRHFLGLMTAVPFLARSIARGEYAFGESLEQEILSHRPNPNLSPNGLYVVPESISASDHQSPLIIPLHMRQLMEAFDRREDLRSASNDNYFDNLRGVIRSAAQGQDVTYILEMPVDLNSHYHIWQKYLDWLVPQIRKGNIVIGNEMWGHQITQSADSKSGSWGQWDHYAEKFAEAHDLIRHLSPRLRIGFSAPHYFGDTEIMFSQLFALRQLEIKSGRKISLDFATLHFYDDDPFAMDRYVRDHRDVLRDFNMPDIPLVLTEYGVREDSPAPKNIDERKTHARKIFAQTAVAAALVSSGDLESAFVYSAYDPTRPQHSLFEQRNGVLAQTLSWSAYELARRLFYKDCRADRQGDDMVFLSRASGGAKYRTTIAVLQQEDATVERLADTNNLFPGLRFGGIEESPRPI